MIDLAYAPRDLAALLVEARGSLDSRSILLDALEEQGREAELATWRSVGDSTHEDVLALRFDELPVRKRTRKRINKMTAAETARMDPWAKEWIQIGLTTGKADRPLFEAAVDAIYRYMNMPTVPVIWTEAPIVAVLAGPIASYLGARETDPDSAVRSAVHSAVGSAVHSAVRSAVGSAVGSAVDSAVRSAVRSAVDSAVFSPAPNWTRADHDNLKNVQRKTGYRWLGGQFWPGWYWGPAYVMYMLDVLRLDIGRDLELKARAYAATVRSACYWYPTTKFILASERPSKIENGGGTWDLGNGQTWAVRP